MAIGRRVRKEEQDIWATNPELRAQHDEARRLHLAYISSFPDPLGIKEGVDLAEARAAIATIAAYNRRLVELGIPASAGLVLPEMPEAPAADTPAEDPVATWLTPYGRRWERGGKRRLYLDLRAVAEAVGFSDRGGYSNGRKVSSFQGEEISNSSARKMAAEFDGSFYDLDARKFVGSGAIFEAFCAHIGA